MGRDLREYARQTDFRLVLGFILLLLFVGDGLIYFFYGQSAAATGLFCIVAGLVPVIMIVVAFWIIEVILKVGR
jgi:hypothetical protein